MLGGEKVTPGGGGIIFVNPPEEINTRNHIHVDLTSSRTDDYDGVFSSDLHMSDHYCDCKNRIIKYLNQFTYRSGSFFFRHISRSSGEITLSG